MYLRTRVPYIPTPRKRIPFIFEHLSIRPETVIYDLGCGKGDILFAAEKRGAKKLVGFELSPLHVWYIRLKALIIRSKVKVHRSDFFGADISEADVIYLFLVKKIVQKLWPKIKTEAKRGVRVVVLCDAAPDHVPGEVIELDKKIGSKLYLYTIL